MTNTTNIIYMRYCVNKQIQEILMQYLKIEKTIPNLTFDKVYIVGNCLLL